MRMLTPIAKIASKHQMRSTANSFTSQKSRQNTKQTCWRFGVNINHACFVDIFFHVVRSYDRLGSLDCKDCLSPVSHRWITIICSQSRKQKAPPPIFSFEWLSFRINYLELIMSPWTNHRSSCNCRTGCQKPHQRSFRRGAIIKLAK